MTTKIRCLKNLCSIIIGDVFQQFRNIDGQKIDNQWLNTIINDYSLFSRKKKIRTIFYLIKYEFFLSFSKTGTKILV